MTLNPIALAVRTLWPRPRLAPTPFELLVDWRRRVIAAGRKPKTHYAPVSWTMP
jgi:hypothetical protein